MKGMIDITGCNLIDVAKAAYALSVPQGMGFIHYQDGDLTDEQASSLITGDERTPLSMDYVGGRACKLTVFKDSGKLFIRESWFDHTDDQLIELLERIRA